MIDMPVGDEYGIQRAYKIPAITQQMNTRLPRVDEEVLSLNQEKHAGEVSLGGWDAGTCS
jgi:hypothetical protein